MSRGDELAEIETDKATMTYEADASGLVQIVARAGDTLPVGATIAHIVGPGEEAPRGDVAQPATPAVPAVDEGAAVSPSSAVALVDSPRPAVMADVERSSSRPRASPLARRVGKALDVELHEVSGTGPTAESFALTSKPPEPPRAFLPSWRSLRREFTNIERIFER